MKIKTIGQLLDYVETEEKAIELINYINKQKEVIDKIKEYINRTEINSVGTPLAYTEIGKELLELLEVNND